MNRKSPVIDVSAFPVTSLDLSRPAAEQIASALKAAILDTSIAPGALISENEVGQLFGASRTPVREAFAQLREDGLIVTWPSRGTYVSKLSEQQIRSAQFLREALEVAVVDRLCSEGVSDKALAALDDNITQQRRAVADGDRASFQALDDRFHALLADATGFARIGGLLIREKAALDRLRVLSLNDADHMSRLLTEHEGILESVRMGYCGQALDRMRRHLRNVLKTLTGLIEANREFFDTAES